MHSGRRTIDESLTVADTSLANLEGVSVRTLDGIETVEGVFLSEITMCISLNYKERERSALGSAQEIGKRGFSSAGA